MDTKKLRQKILDLAIRGKLVPQDPNDEPASVLLERIRAEKERLIKEGKIKRSKKTAAAEEIEAPFEIPESWEWTTVGNVCETCLGKMLDKQKNQGVLHPYLRNINVRWGNFDLSDLLQMPFEDSETERYSICYDDLVVCEGGEPGRCAIWKDNKPIRFQKALHRVRCYKGISNYFLQTVLRLFFENGMLEMYYTGSTIKHLTGDSLNSIVIPLPPEKEQIRIVSLVEKWFAVIDELESNEGDLLKAIDQAKSKILDLAIHGKLVPQDPNDEPASVMLDKLSDEKAELVKKGNLKKKDLEVKPIHEDEKPFEIPGNWEWCRLKAISSKIVDGDHNPPRGINDDSGYYMLSSKNINHDRVELLDDVRFLSYEDWKKCNDRTHLTRGDVLLTTVATLGRSCVYENDIPYCFQRSVSIISTYINNFFLKYCFDSPYYQTLIDDNATGTAQRGFYINQLEESIIPVPPYLEQLRIVAKIEELFAVLDSIKESLK